MAALYVSLAGLFEVALVDGRVLGSMAESINRKTIICAQNCLNTKKFKAGSYWVLFSQQHRVLKLFNTI
jgi:hypothetical protein